MNTDVKQMWLDALRSGDYVQGRGQLRTNNDNYCCLGVLCDIAVKNNVIPAPQKVKGYWTYGSTSHGNGVIFDGSDSSLPRSVWIWAGLTRNNPIIEMSEQGRNMSLAQYNDDGVPFTEIADLIEEYL